MANFGFTITVEGKEKLQEIEKIVNKIGEKQNIKLNIDTSFSNKISDIENKLKNIEETIKNSNSIKFTPISKDTESQINNANNRINELGRTIKTVSKYGQTGDIKEQIQTINTELGKTVQIINHYKNGIFSGTNENHITNYDKIAKSVDKITNKIEKYKQSLNSIENNGNIFGKLNTDNVANSFQALDNMDYLLHKIKDGGQVQELDIKKAFDEADKSLKILQQDYDRVSKLNSLTNQYKELLSTAKQFKDLGLNHIGVFNGNSKITGINNELKTLKQALNSKDLSSAEQIISKIQSELGHLKVNDKMLINLSTQLKNIRNQYNELKSGKDIFSQINENDINNYLKSLKQVENIRKIEIKLDDEFSKKWERKKEIRIGNTLALYNRNLLNEVREKLPEVRNYILDMNYNFVASLVIDGTLKAAGGDYLVFVYNSIHDVNLFNDNIDKIELLFEILYNKKYKVIATSIDEWEKIRDDFNHKKKVFTFVDEKEETIQVEKDNLTNQIEDDFGTLITVE